MKRMFISICLILTIVAQSDTEMVRKVRDEVMMNGKAYDQLWYLTQKIGSRLSGSPQAAAAVEWARQEMERMGFDKVWLQETKVPHWVRGAAEEVKLVGSKTEGDMEFKSLALGGSVATPPEGITAEVVQVMSLDEVDKLGKSKIEGKIVFYNRPFDQTLVDMGEAYGKAVDQRGGGPSKAAQYGAVGVIIRSMASVTDDFPHTGGLRYADGIKKIPAAAISTIGADHLTRIMAKEKNVRIHMKINSQWLPDEVSYNVIGEITGSDMADEIITIGGHLDSWDVGQGAHDDGSGVVQSIEVLRALKAIGYKPKRTLRAVAFMNEENGLRGGTTYAAEAKRKGEKHIAGIESDAGGFTPRGFDVNSTKEVIEKMQPWLQHFDTGTIGFIEAGGGGADIGPLNRNLGTPSIELHPDRNRYFDYHHTNNDTFDKVNKRELHLGAASMAGLVYLIDKYGL
ncbi:MAG: M20/M25/M40 family metallo-hydrolase [Calditrichaeota bacterium]|nr:M20/M25/M40 family metallo-hydrolase [Calditrichota bacterium]